jgi:hypothetical protein
MEESRALIEAGMEQQAGADSHSCCQSQSRDLKDSDKYSGMRQWLLLSLPASIPLAEKATIFTQLAGQKMTLALLKRVSRDELKDLGLFVGHRMVLWDALQKQKDSEKMVLEEVRSGAGGLDRNQGS